MLEHGLALLIFIGRLGDVLSTLYVTPNMLLEANLLARRFKRTTMLFGFALCIVPYYDVQLGVMVAVPLLLVTASNLSKGWIARALGEKELERVVLRAAAAGSLVVTLSMCWLAAAFIMTAAAVLLWLSDNGMVYWFGIGMGLYALAIAVHGSLFFIRLFHRARAGLGQADQLQVVA